MLLTVIAALMTPSVGAGIGVQSDAKNLFPTFPDVVALGKERRCAYRMRRVEYDGGEVSSKPTTIVDGVVRIGFSPEGLLEDAVQYVLSSKNGWVPQFQREVTFYSFNSGEFARSTLLAGGLRESITCGYWSNLPSIAYYSLGAVAPNTHISETQWGGLRGADDGHEFATFMHSNGDQVEVEYALADPLVPHRLRRVHIQNGVEEQTRFYGWDSLVGSPRTIVRVTTGPDGTVHDGTAWQVISGAWASADWGHTIPQGSLVMDMRALDGRGQGVTTDRSMLLSQVLVWPRYSTLASPADRRFAVVDDNDLGLSNGGAPWMGMAIGAGILVVALIFTGRRCVEA